MFFSNYTSIKLLNFSNYTSKKSLFFSNYTSTKLPNFSNYTLRKIAIFSNYTSTKLNRLRIHFFAIFHHWVEEDGDVADGEEGIGTEREGVVGDG